MRLFGLVAIAAALAVPRGGPAPDAGPVGRGGPGSRAGQGEQGTPPGFTRLLVHKDGRWVLDGWSHQGPGEFTLDSTTGVLETHGGMGLLWYTRQEYRDFTLELDFKVGDSTSNSGVFLRVPGVPTSDDYIYHSWEIQIDQASAGIHTTGAVYDAEAPSEAAARPPGEWNHYAITFRGSHITVVLNGTKVVDWEAEPRGKVRDFAHRGYVGLQNHEGGAPVWFRDVLIKELR
jgi:hypothetical protein